MYLQRVATKNDTFSEFGPSGWGTVAVCSLAKSCNFAPEQWRRGA